MEEQYEYEIQEITGLSFQQVKSLVDLWPQSVDEGRLNVGVNNLLDRLKANASRVFLLRWTGNKVPRGAKLGEHTIGGTQGGVVVNEGGQRIGYYNRLVEFGGDSGKEHVLLVYVRR